MILLQLAWSLKKGLGHLFWRIMKQRKDDAIHELKRENKNLQDEIKRLKRQINNEAKEEKRISKSKSKEPEIKERTANSCNECGSNDLVQLELGIKIYKHCIDCRHRELVKK